MQTRRIGDVQVSAIGLGAMPMSVEGAPDRDQSIETIHAALDAGVTLIDTADAYHPNAETTGHNEEIVAEALKTWGGDSDAILVATKGGHTRPGGAWGLDGRPEYLKAAAKASALRSVVRRSGCTSSTVRTPMCRGPSRWARSHFSTQAPSGAGVSNANPTQIREAQEVLGGRLAAVQNEYSPKFRSSQPRPDAVRRARHRVPAVEPPGGQLAGSHLGSVFAPFARWPTSSAVSPQQVCLAWERRCGASPVVVPTPGSQPAADRSRDSVEAVHVRPSDGRRHASTRHG